MISKPESEKKISKKKSKTLVTEGTKTMESAGCVPTAPILEKPSKPASSFKKEKDSNSHPLGKNEDAYLTRKDV